MKRILQALILSSLTFGSTFAFAADTHGSLPGDGKSTSSHQTNKSHKRKGRSSKMDQQILSESRAEGGSLSSQEEIDEIREALGEK